MFKVMKHFLSCTEWNYNKFEVIPIYNALIKVTQTEYHIVPWSCIIMDVAQIHYNQTFHARVIILRNLIWLSIRFPQLIPDWKHLVHHLWLMYIIWHCGIILYIAHCQRKKYIINRWVGQFSSSWQRVITWLVVLKNTKQRKSIIFMHCNLNMYSCKSRTMLINIELQVDSWQPIDMY